MRVQKRARRETEINKQQARTYLLRSQAVVPTRQHKGVTRCVCGLSVLGLEVCRALLPQEGRIELRLRLAKPRQELIPPPSFPVPL